MPIFEAKGNEPLEQFAKVVVNSSLLKPSMYQDSMSFSKIRSSSTPNSCPEALVYGTFVAFWEGPVTLMDFSTDVAMAEKSFAFCSGSGWVEVLGWTQGQKKRL